MIKVYKGSEDVISLIISNRKNYYDECDNFSFMKFLKFFPFLSILHKNKQSALKKRKFLLCLNIIYDKVYFSDIITPASLIFLN